MMKRVLSKLLASTLLLVVFAGLQFDKAAAQNVETLWERSVANDNLPEWFQENVDRSTAYWVNGSDEVVVEAYGQGFSEDNFGIHLLDPEDGEDLGELDMDGYGGSGTFVISDANVTDDGKLLVSNYGENHFHPFRIHLWDDQESAPQEVLTHEIEEGEDKSLARYFNVTGSYEDGTARIYAISDDETFRLFVFEQEGEGEPFDSEPTEIEGDFSLATNPNAIGIPGTDYIAVTSSGSPVELFNTDGDHIGEIDTDLISERTTKLDYLGEENGSHYLAITTYAEGGEDQPEFVGYGAKIFGIPDGDPDDAYIVHEMDALGEEGNLNGTGGVSFVANDDGSFTGSLLITNNGIASYHAELTDEEPPEVTEYETIAEIIDEAEEGDVATLTGEAIVTYIDRDTRNQHYIADETGAILVDNNEEVLGDDFEIGDGITDLEFEFSMHFDTRQIVPQENPGVSSTDNELPVFEIALEDFSADEHQSMLVEIEETEFLDEGVFENNENYDIIDPTISDEDPATFTTHSLADDLDYFGKNIPQEPFNLRGIVTIFQENPQVTARSSEDFIDIELEERIDIVAPPEDDATLLQDFPLAFNMDTDEVDWHDPTFFPFDGAELARITNPDQTGVNETDYVLEYEKVDDGQAWAGFFYHLEDQINLTDESVFRMQVWSPRSDIEGIMKLEQQVGDEETPDIIAEITESGEWIELEWDLSDADQEINWDQVTVIFDLDTDNPPEGGEDHTWYLDEFALENVEEYIEPDPVVEYWEFSDAEGNLPDWFEEDTYPRGGGFGIVEGHQRMVYANRDHARLHDAYDGSFIQELSVEGLEESIFDINVADFTEDGKIIAAGLTLNTADPDAWGGGPFHVHLWDGIDADPENIISFESDNEHRVGDQINVVGSYEDGTAQVIAAAGQAPYIYVFSMDNGEFDGENPEIIEVEEEDLEGEVGMNPNAYPVGEDQWLFNANGMTPALVNSDGSVAGSVPEYMMPEFSNNIKVVNEEEDGSFSFITLIPNFNTDDQARIQYAEVPEGNLADTKLFEPTASLGDVENANASGAVDYYYDEEADSYDFFIIELNNGTARIDFEKEPMEIPDPLPQVTFNLDMSEAIADEVYDPEVHDVYVSGSFADEWTEPGENPDFMFEPIEDEDDIYALTLEVEEGDHEYKYFLVEDDPTWDLGEWEGDPNREISVTEDMEINDTFGNQDDQTVSAEDIMTDLPQEVGLEQNYPNPFNPVTTIQYQLPADTHVELTVYNTLGQQVETLIDGRVEAGTHEVSFDGSNLASGVYIYRLQTDSKVISNQMTLVK